LEGLPATSTPNATTGGTTGGGFLDNLGSSLTSLLPSGSNLATLGLGAAGLYEANQQKKTNDAQAATLTGLGKPYVDAGQTALKQAQAGTLNPQQQALQNSQLGQGTTLTGQAGPLLDIANTAFKQYQAGQLPAWQQAELDQQKADAMAQLKQSLGAQVDSSTLAQAMAGIDKQFETAKGQLLQQNLATGQSAESQGQGIQGQGFAATNAGWQTGVDAVQQSFTNAINLATAGNGPVAEAVQLAIAGDTQLTNNLMQFYGALAKSYASNASGTSKSSGLGSLLSGASGALSGGNAVRGLVNAAGNGVTDTTALTGTQSLLPSDLPTSTPDLGIDPSTLDTSSLDSLF
jgi:hypothetical protein